MDIVERLRSDGSEEQRKNLGILPSVAKLMLAAADEIERLREIEREWKDAVSAAEDRPQ